MRTGGLVLFLAMTAATAAAADVTVTGGWFRALPPAIPSGGYFTLHNGGPQAVTVTGLASPACGMLMMHKSENGGMTEVDTLPVAPGQTVRFAPGGYHLMCTDATPRLQRGAQVPVTLHFAQGGSVTAQFQVRGPSGK